MQTSNEKLRMALEECMEKDLSFIPDDREIKKSYVPSKQFKKNMKKITSMEGQKIRLKRIGKEKGKITIWLAAAAIIIISMRIGFSTLFLANEKHDLSMPQSQSEESKQEYSTESTTEAMPDESYDTSAAEESNARSDSRADAGELRIWSYSDVTDTQITLTLTNNTKSNVSYTDINWIEKREGDSWKTIYIKDQPDEHDLSEGTIVEEKIQRADYNMEESGYYQLYRMVDGNQISLELEVQ